MVTDCKIYVKRYKCDLYKILKKHSSITTYIKNWKYNTYVLKKEKCQCVIKKYCSVYLVKKGKYIDYKNLSPKCINNSNYSTLLIYLFLLIYNFKMLY